jgi:predicted MFS family arabinose efflux permease
VLPVSAVKQDRWLVIVAYALLGAANQLLWLTFTPITTPAAHRYGVSVSDIGWLSEIFPLLYVILAVPAASLLDRWFRPSLALGAVMTAVGGALRLIGPSYGSALVGQLLVALAQPLVLNAITGLATAYLSDKQRPTGIAVGSAGVFLGMLISLTLGSALGGGHLHALLLIGAIYGIVTAVGLLAVLAVGEHPPIVGDVTGRDGLRTVWQDMITRRLAGVAFIGFGFFVALTTWLQALLKHNGIHASTAGWLLVAAVVTGVIGSAVLPPPIVRARAEARLFRLAAGATATVCVVMAIWRTVPVVAVCVCVAGLLLLASLPVLLEVCEHRAGPAGTSATALIWLSGNAGGIVIAILVQIVVNHPTVAFLLMGVIAALGVAVVPHTSLRLASAPPSSGEVPLEQVPG